MKFEDFKRWLMEKYSPQHPLALLPGIADEFRKLGWFGDADVVARIELVREDEIFIGDVTPHQFDRGEKG